MTAQFFPTVFLGAVMMIATGQQMPRPDVPGKISAPQNERVVLATHASGFQVYVCGVAADGQWAWTLRGPEAELLDARGVMVGRHYAGPTWKHNDGSAVIGKMQAKVDFPEPGAVPWLLLVATGPFRKRCTQPRDDGSANPYQGWPATAFRRLHCLPSRY